MKTFMDEDFLLETKTAQTLYNDYAKDQPIFDFHCHLSPQEIYEDHTLRILRKLGLVVTTISGVSCAPTVDEELITGDAPGRDKFKAYANPLPPLAIRSTTGRT